MVKEQFEFFEGHLDCGIKYGGEELCHYHGSYEEFDEILFHDIKNIADLLNKLQDEKEKWKSTSISSLNENSILWDEISILREQGAEPSNAFKEYLENILTDYDKFWRKKLEQAKKSGLIY